MNGLLRSLKYLSHLFDEKEPEMQIGLPTDVKHVAHIGMDGPSASKPSWMSGFNSAPELSSVPLNGNLQGKPSASGNPDSLPPVGNEKQKKQRRKTTANGSPAGSPKVTEKHSRRQRSSNLSIESPGRDSSSHGRRHKNSSSRDSESSSQELADIPKRSSRQKKSKGSSGGSEASSSSSRSKAPNFLPEIVELES